MGMAAPRLQFAYEPSYLAGPCWLLHPHSDRTGNGRQGAPPPVRLRHSASVLLASYISTPTALITVPHLNPAHQGASTSGESHDPTSAVPDSEYAALQQFHCRTHHHASDLAESRSYGHTPAECTRLDRSRSNGRFELSHVPAPRPVPSYRMKQSIVTAGPRAHLLSTPPALFVKRVLDIALRTRTSQIKMLKR